MPSPCGQNTAFPPPPRIHTPASILDCTFSLPTLFIHKPLFHSPASQSLFKITVHILERVVKVQSSTSYLCISCQFLTSVMYKFTNMLSLCFEKGLLCRVCLLLIKVGIKGEGISISKPYTEMCLASTLWFLFMM